MRKKVAYLGIGFVVLGIILVLMGIFVMSDSGLWVLSGNFETIRDIFLIRSIMNWLGIFFSISGAIVIIIGVALDEQVIDIKSQQMTDMNSYCYECGVKLEGTPEHCYACGTKLR